MIRGTSYKILAGLAVAAALAGQRWGASHATGTLRLVMGYAASALLLASVVELATPVLGRRWILPNRDATIRPRAVVFFFTSLLALAACARPIAPFLTLMPRTPPTNALAALIGFWVLAVALLARRGYSTRWLAWSTAGLMIGTRLLVQWVWPFRRLDGDMLGSIAGAFDAMNQGRSPYLSGPPPMPYLPLTLLTYAPPWALGVDLRYANIACDAATAVAAVYLGRLVAKRAGRDADAGPVVEQLALPCLMMHPIWTHFSANTQFPPCVLLATLLGFATLLAGRRLQATTLGLAVASNQMLGACGPTLWARWARESGPKRALGLGLLAFGTFLLILGPFLAWDAAQLARAAFLTRDRLPESFMAGRLTFLPLASRLLPHAGPIATALILAAASWASCRARSPRAALAAMSGGLCAAMMFQPVSFGHYFLPAIALAAIAPPSGGDDTDPGSKPTTTPAGMVEG